LTGISHKLLWKLSWLSLSEADRDIWKLKVEIPEEAPAFLRRYQPTSVEEKIAYYSLFLDLMGWRTRDLIAAPEFTLAGTYPVPHGLPTHRFTGAWAEENLYDTLAWRTIFRTFIPQLLENLERGENERAAQLAGLLAHVIQDAASFGHILPNQLFYQLFPEETGPHFNYHQIFDEPSPDLQPVSPVLLGTSPAEFIFRLAMAGEQNYRQALRLLIPAVQLCRHGEISRLNNLVQPLFHNTVFQVASLFHTAAALASGRVRPDEKTLATFDLTLAVEHYLHPAPKYGSVVPRHHSLVAGQRVPLVLNSFSGPVTISRGFGLSSFHSLRFLLEPGAFDLFEGEIGLSCQYTEEQEEQMDLEFFIGLDTAWNTTVTSDLEYGPALTKVFSCRLRPGEPAITFSVPLHRAQTLLLAVLPHPKKIDGKEVCWYPHVVLGNPRLVKSTR